MARLAPSIYRFELSNSPDVASYRLYWAKVSQGNPSYAWDFDEVSLADAETGLDLVSRFPGYEGPITVAATALDARGNESDFGGVASVTLDFQAPNPPGAGTIGS